MSELLVTRDGAVATVTLNRPDALNAWTPSMGQSLLDALRGLGADPAVRCVVITGAGRAFSAGADVKGPREATGDGAVDLTSRLRDIYNPIILEVRRMEKPVVAAVNGVAAGLGASLALACDLIVCVEEASFLLAFVRIAVAPDAGAAYHLKARIGAARAAELCMLGGKLPAPRALDWGLVNDVVPADALAATVNTLAQRLAAGPTVALASVKRVLDGPGGLQALEAQLRHEADLQQRHATTADYAEGVAAFKEKRPPAFTGH